MGIAARLGVIVGEEGGAAIEGRAYGDLAVDGTLSRLPKLARRFVRNDEDLGSWLTDRGLRTLARTRERCEAIQALPEDAARVRGAGTASGSRSRSGASGGAEVPWPCGVCE